MAPMLICANWNPEQTDCKKKGRYTCKGCLLVIYCGPECQKSHWPQHKIDCKSALAKKSWQPTWVLGNRSPVSGAEEVIGRNFLWGNVPALDVLKLASNEGESYAEDLRLLFAASGDLRNVIKTLADLPTTYSQSLSITINDRDFDVVARNLMILLVALVVEKKEAIDCTIHLWYSALVRNSDIDILLNRVRRLIEDVCSEIQNNAPGVLIQKTWTFGSCSLRITLETSSWVRLLSYFELPAGLTTEQAKELRADTTLAHSRSDIRDQIMCILLPPQRIPFLKFLQDGLLLPFGMPRHDFKRPNPTLFHTADAWPMADHSDPLHGWDVEEVFHTSSGPATADTYGKLYFYLREVLESFLDRISHAKVAFELHNVDASYLPRRLEKESFSRIEVSNISDEGWLGIHRTLQLMVPLLQPPTQNPHATLITLFINVIKDMLTDAERVQGIMLNSQVKDAVLRFVSPYRSPKTKHDPVDLKFRVAAGLVMNCDHIFDRYQKIFRFRGVEECLGVRMKEHHTVIDKCPYRMKRCPDQEGAKEKFDWLMRQGSTRREYYLEWKRVNRVML